jgi:hypothetical protein
MKEVLISQQKRQDLTNWLLEIPAKYANPILQFLQENEIQTYTEEPVIGGGGSGAKPPKKSE